MGGYAAEGLTKTFSSIFRSFLQRTQYQSDARVQTVNLGPPLNGGETFASAIQPVSGQVREQSVSLEAKKLPSARRSIAAATTAHLSTTAVGHCRATDTTTDTTADRRIAGSIAGWKCSLFDCEYNRLIEEKRSNKERSHFRR